MANSFTQIHIHGIAAVKFRRALIDPSWNEKLHVYISGIMRNCGHKMLSINSMPDHLHFLFGFRPVQSLSQLMDIIKGESSEWINVNKLSSKPFRWQAGYGAFSYSKSQIPAVARYIEKQGVHHRKKTFLEEYVSILDDFGVSYDSRYIFKPLE